MRTRTVVCHVTKKKIIGKSISPILEKIEAMINRAGNEFIPRLNLGQRKHPEQNRLNRTKWGELVQCVSSKLDKIERRKRSLGGCSYAGSSKQYIDIVSLGNFLLLPAIVEPPQPLLWLCYYK